MDGRRGIKNRARNKPAQMAAPPKRNDEFQFGCFAEPWGVRKSATTEEHMM
jgi:hypothetical protein